MVLSRKLSKSAVHTHLTMRSRRELEGILSDRHEDITNLHDQLATSHSRSVQAPNVFHPSFCAYEGTACTVLRIHVP